MNKKNIYIFLDHKLFSRHKLKCLNLFGWDLKPLKGTCDTDTEQSFIHQTATTLENHYWLEVI